MNELIMLTKKGEIALAHYEVVRLHNVLLRLRRHSKLALKEGLTSVWSRIMHKLKRIKKDLQVACNELRSLLG